MKSEFVIYIYMGLVFDGRILSYRLFALPEVYIPREEGPFICGSRYIYLLRLTDTVFPSRLRSCGLPDIAGLCTSI